MPVIQVTLVEGRPASAKRELIAALTDAAERTLAAPRTTIRVVLAEVPAENWGVAGEPKRPYDA
jgi:4-oxalocrotonate tautomerase